MTQEQEELIGSISHFFGKISVGIIELTGTLRVGESVHIKGHTTDFVQAITSMQIEHAQVEEAKAGDSVGIKVDQPVREGDTVYRAK
ncbi:MAG: hypothetical protein GTO55_06650 [Armatimonadetes bacterium]|nr:hypothetical protein [Armatimonadota bacterium]NIM23961.1 hypothetical protein [Armatimonadota bacterium]NIM67808.1 hypothetical protein [Armatimonadota bacterium]NIM76348.1 hypothetical protein [Armatimonadota bacterium]NIN06042.1 hypothetical protein [Armatimonadota bacterium]